MWKYITLEASYNVERSMEGRGRERRRREEERGWEREKGEGD